MIEVSLYSIPAGSDVNATMGKCVDRIRYDKDTMGSSVMEFTKGFLKTNVGTLELALKNQDIVNFINSDTAMTTSDFASINYWLAKSGYLVKIFNVAEDEENPVGIQGEIVEWNIIDNNFNQNDYPTAVKIVSNGTDVADILKKIVDQSNLFGEKLGATRNPAKDLVDSLEKTKEVTGRIEPGIAGRIYDILDQTGIKIFLATSSD